MNKFIGDNVESWFEKNIVTPVAAGLGKLWGDTYICNSKYIVQEGYVGSSATVIVLNRKTYQRAQVKGDMPLQELRAQALAEIQELESRNKIYVGEV